ncbi:MAG TPA: hypothetical protein VKA85_03970 [Candidatus Limnocylindrales bacterium]|nr:hypothetical protein [Candidatus Limnocylindrales bacterium]
MTDSNSDGRTSHQILEQWRELVRAQEAVGPESNAGRDLEPRIESLRREYLTRFDKTAGRSTATGAILSTSDEFIGALNALGDLVKARQGVSDGDTVKLDEEIRQMSAEVLRLSELQLEGGDNMNSRDVSIDELAAQRDRA